MVQRVTEESGEHTVVGDGQLEIYKWWVFGSNYYKGVQ